MKNVNKIISKAIVDENFFKSLIMNFEDTISEFNLSNEEKSYLSGINFSELKNMNNEFESKLTDSVAGKSIVSREVFAASTLDCLPDDYFVGYNDW